MDLRLVLKYRDHLKYKIVWEVFFIDSGILLRGFLEIFKEVKDSTFPMDSGIDWRLLFLTQSPDNDWSFPRISGRVSNWLLLMYKAFKLWRFPIDLGIHFNPFERKILKRQNKVDIGNIAYLGKTSKVFLPFYVFLTEK